MARDRSPIVVNDTNGVIAREEPTADAYGSLGVRAVILCPLARVANGVRGARKAAPVRIRVDPVDMG